MTERNRWKAILPTEVAETLKDLRNTKDSRLSDYVVALRGKGWSLATLAEPIGITREGVRLLGEVDPIGTAMAELNCKTWGFDLPEKPSKPVPPKREVVEPRAEVVSRLLELQPMAQQVRGNSMKYRAEAEEYSRLVAEEIGRGVFANTLAKRLGVTHSAIKFRMVRYGYSTTRSPELVVYRPILDKNRVKA